MYKLLKVLRLLLLLGLSPINNLLMIPYCLGDASVGEVRLWKQILNDYAVVSGQCINYEKSKVYFFNTD